MPRYFFHVYDGRPVRDDEGVELSDLAAARRDASRIAMELMADDAEAVWNGDGWQIEVTNEKMDTVLVLTLTPTIVATTSSGRRRGESDAAAGGAECRAF